MNKHLQRWHEQGLLTAEQLEALSSELEQHNQQNSSNRLISALALVGASALGLSVLSFVAANWQVLTASSKISIAGISTLVVLMTGFWFRFQSKAHHLLGEALIFLASLMFSGTVLLVAQVYNLDFQVYQQISIILAGIIPLMYLTRVKALGIVVVALTFFWVGTVGDLELEGVIMLLPIWLLLLSMGWFMWGSFHALWPGFEEFRRMFKQLGLGMGMLFLLMLTFRFFSGALERYGISRLDDFSSADFQVLSMITLLGVFAVMIMSVIRYFVNPEKEPAIKFETVISLLILTMLAAFSMSSRLTDLFSYLFSLLFLGIAVFVIKRGAQMHDYEVLSVGSNYLLLFLLIKYFDFFWQMMDKSIFFLMGGVLFLLASFSMERQKKQLKAQFEAAETGG